MLTPEIVSAILTKRAAEAVPAVSVDGLRVTLVYASPAAHAARVSPDVESLRKAGGHALVESESVESATAPGVVLRFAPKADEK